MKQISPLLLRNESDGKIYYLYFCPGCKGEHLIPAEIGIKLPGRWEFNGNANLPSFQPSVRHFVPAQGNLPERTFCHYFITEGQIIYCGDCDHWLNSKTVPLPPLSNDVISFYCDEGVDKMPDGLNLGKLNAGGKGPVDAVDESKIAASMKTPTPDAPHVDPAAQQNALLNRDASEPDKALAANAAETVHELAPVTPNLGTDDYRQSADEGSSVSRTDPNARPDLTHAKIPAAGASVEDIGSQTQFPDAPAQPDVIYTCHPMQRLNIGTAYQFENGQLKLSAEDAFKFDEVMKSMDSRTKNQVKKIDVDRANALISARLPQATKSIDSVDRVQQQGTQVGTTALESLVQRDQIPPLA